MSLKFKIEGTPSEVERWCGMHPADVEREITNLLAVLMMRNADSARAFKPLPKAAMEARARDAHKAALKAIRSLTRTASTEGARPREAR